MPTDAVRMLKTDHQRLRALFARLRLTTERTGKARSELLTGIEVLSKVHSQIEEEVFYPSYLNAVSDREDRLPFFRANEEHHVYDVVLTELKATDPKTELFTAKSQLLETLTLAHMKYEEAVLFARARELMGDELGELGEKMEKRRETLLAQWESPILRTLKKLHSAVQGLTPARMKHAKSATIAAAVARKKRRSA